MPSNDELACVYAALILMDDEVPITVEKISTILKAANVTVEPYWPGLFAKAASGLDLKAIVCNVGSGVGTGGGGGGVAAPAGGSAAAADAPAAEEKKEESAAEESDDDMGFSLFG
ncbi:large ribosomal subunit protein P1 [Macrobrachium rosenbergii]|uniref:large ribosomal subunit protein P1-like n=1 Tax=Macrobrachium nipponense TaxID=159736 RepID=UPI0010B609CE